MQRFRNNEACSFTRGLYLELTRFQLKNKILAKNVSLMVIEERVAFGRKGNGGQRFWKFRKF